MWCLALATEVAVEERRAAIAANDEAIWVVPEHQIAMAAVAQIAHRRMNRPWGLVCLRRKRNHCSPHLVSRPLIPLQVPSHRHISLFFKALHSVEDFGSLVQSIDMK
jgi:hypothetical protein